MTAVVSFDPRTHEDGVAGTMKTFELLSIIGSIAAVGIALGVIVIGSVSELRTDVRTEIQSFRTEVRAEMQSFRAEVRADIHAVEARLSAVEQRQAKTEGLLEGLRDAITARSAQDPPARETPA